MIVTPQTDFYSLLWEVYEYIESVDDSNVADRLLQRIAIAIRELEGETIEH